MLLTKLTELAAQCETLDEEINDLELRLIKKREERANVRLLLKGHIYGKLPAGEHLTNRQAEILEFLRMRLRNKEIAQRLSISERTVKFHVGKLLEKFDACSRNDLLEGEV